MNQTVVVSGTRVRLLTMNDPQAPPVGTLGTVTDSVGMGSWVLIAMRWDNGSYLGLAVPPDGYEVVK